MERPDDRAEKAQADGAGEFENSISPVPAPACSGSSNYARGHTATAASTANGRG